MERTYENTIKFLNSRAYNVFERGTGFVNFTRFKKNLLFAMNMIENVFRGTFHSDLFVAKVDENKFQRLFPNGYRLFKNNIGQLAHYLDNIRNCFAHAYLSKSDLEIFTYKFSMLEQEPKFNDDISYVKEDGRITVAGLIFIIFNFLREQSIERLCKNDILFGIVASGSFNRDDGSTFVRQISHVDLENYPIREVEGNDIKTALLGEYISALKEDEFSLAFGSPNNPLYHVSGVIKDNSITIKGDSLTSTYYPNDYQISVEYVDGFIELANKLPELLIVDIMKENGCNVFDRHYYDELKSKWKLISKLNYPKYYEDKNIKTIFVSDKIADYRIMNSLINDAVSSICILLEKCVYKSYHLRNDKYSKFSYAIKEVVANDDSVNQFIALRNLGVHGIPWGGFVNVGNKIYYHSVDFVFDTLELLLVELNRSDADIYASVSKEIADKLIKKICTFRYSQMNKETKLLLGSYPNFRLTDEMKKAMLFVDHPMFETNRLDKLNSLCDNQTYQHKLIVPFLNNPIYLENEYGSNKVLENFCLSHGFKKEDVEGGRTLGTIRLIKA